MSDDVLAAAERCRGLAGPGWVDVAEASPECVADLLTLARAYLAANPADDATAVDETWLRAVGWQTSPGSSAWVHTRLAGGLAVHLRLTLDECRLYDASAKWVAIPVPATRGHVRRLCAALGVPLTEGPGC